MTDFDFPGVIKNSERFYPLAKLTDRFFNLPTWLANISDIGNVDPSFYPYLADELDIAETEAWQSSRSDKERVHLLETAYERMSQRGTGAGLKREAAEAGGEVRRIIAPPNKLFASPALTIAEKNAWLSQHPELRIYPQRLPGISHVAMCGSAFPGYKCFAGPGTALERSRLRAVLVKDGQMIELETADWQLANAQKQVVNEFTIPGNAGYASFVGRPGRFIAATDISNRRITLSNVAYYNESHATLNLRTITTGFKPLEADGVMVSEIRPAPNGVSYCGGFGRFSSRSEAANHHYWRIRLFDPSVPAAQKRGASFLGYSRLTLPPHTAIVDVAFFSHRNPNWGRFPGYPIVASDKAPLERLLNNMRLAARKTDQISVNTKIFRPATAGLHYAGELYAGEFTSK